MSTFAAKISELNKQIKTIGEKLASLADRRKEFSLAASDGDSHARKQIQDVDFELASLRSEAETLGAAAETALALERQQQLEEQQKQERARQLEAYNTARAVITLNEELDLRLTQLRQAFERRASLLGELNSMNLLDVVLLSRMASKAPATRAACAANLHRFLSLETCAPGSMVPLSSTNEQLLSIGEPPDNKSPPTTHTPRLNNGGNNKGAS
jgi:hypothetical protein